VLCFCYVRIILSIIASSVRDNIGENMKKETYRERWLKAHPQIRLYLSKEEYELLKQIADKNKMSYKELIMKTIHDIKGYEAGYEEAIRDISEGNENAKKYLEKYKLEFITCTICDKPFGGYIILKDGKLGKRIKELVKSEGWKHATCTKK
jgi:hypothetical protein